MEEFMEYEEEFEARQSISSRGSAAQPSKGRGTIQKLNAQQQRETVNKPEERTTQYLQQEEEQDGLHDYNQANEGEENFNEGESSSVITEIVEEKVIELDTENEDEIAGGKDKEDGGIDQYLDNIKQEDYVNRDEYQEFEDNKGASPYQNEEEQVQNQYAQDPQEIDQEAQEYNQEQNYQQEADNQYMVENSPIEENPLEEEITSSPQYVAAPRAINPKYRKKYEGTDLNDKRHLVWEQERIERKRIERQMKRSHFWTKKYDSRDIDWHPITNPKRAAYNLEKNPQRSNLWHFSNTSNVPMLTTAKGIKTNAANKISKAKYDPSEAQAKHDHKINNVFLQSSYQNLLSGKNGIIDAPNTHVSLKKEIGRGFMTAIDNRYQHQTNVEQGRQRMFHSSQVF